MRIPMYLLTLLVTTFLAGNLHAEKPLSSPETLLKQATNVVTGKVMAIYQRSEKVDNWEYTRFVAEIRVKNSEKGDGIADDSLVYVRYWRKAWLGRGNPPPDTAGHSPIPKVDDAVRVYLARNSYDGFTNENKDGGYNVIGVNGFEKLQPNPSK